MKSLEFVRQVASDELKFYHKREDELRESIKDKTASDFDYGLYTGYQNASMTLERILRVIESEERYEEKFNKVEKDRADTRTMVNELRKD